MHNSQIFTGHGNTQDDAKTHAIAKYQSWRADQRKAGKRVEELNQELNYRQINQVYWCCDVRVSFSLHPKSKV